MFKMVKTLTTWWPVTIFEPSADKPGTFEEFSFDIEFEIIDRDEQKANADARAAIFAEGVADTSEANLRLMQTKLDAQQLKEFQRVVRNWRGIVDDKEKSFPFTDKNLLEMMKRDHIREGINAAYSDAIATGKARLGN